jgi:hypothetical protein
MGGRKEIAPSEISEQLKAGNTGACCGNKRFILECRLYMQKATEPEIGDLGAKKTMLGKSQRPFDFLCYYFGVLKLPQQLNQYHYH